MLGRDGDHAGGVAKCNSEAAEQQLHQALEEALRPPRFSREDLPRHFNS